MTFAEDPDEIFKAMTDGIVLEEPDDLDFTADHIERMELGELMGTLTSVEDALMESGEILLPRSHWAQDMHNLRFALRQEIKRRNVAP